ncbi:MAG TPA: amidohydrolase family protein, partial [Terriglobales bacterium]|nr:amidohydrolase family protein [Terriglobales bacterium]
AATMTPARFIGRERTSGEVKGGKVADLVLLDDDPLKDIRNTRKIVGVFSKGRYFSRADLDDLLRQAALSFGSAPPETVTPTAPQK